MIYTLIIIGLTFPFLIYLYLLREFKRKVDGHHIHIWSNWRVESDNTFSVSNTLSGKKTGEYRVIQQSRTCGICGFKDIYVKKEKTSSVEWG